MRKIILSLTILVVFSISAQAQDKPLNVIKVNPLGALFGSAQLSYERALNEKSSFLLSPSFGFFKVGGFKYTTMGIGAEYRFYLSSSQEAPAGFYAGPGVGYSFGQAKMDNSSDSHSSEKINISGFTAKGILGYQWIWDSGFSLDLNGGIQYFGFGVKDKSESSQGFTPFSGILPALGVSIGYAF